MGSYPHHGVRPSGLRGLPVWPWEPKGYPRLPTHLHQGACNCPQLTTHVPHSNLLALATKLGIPLTKPMTVNTATHAHQQHECKFLGHRSNVATVPSSEDSDVNVCHRQRQMQMVIPRVSTCVSNHLRTRESPWILVKSQYALHVA